MMLRSSSTPVLGSLLPSIPPESTNHHHRHHHHHHHDTTLHPCIRSPMHKFSFNRKLSCNSSPTPSSNGNGGIRRAQSEGNLESLTSSCGGRGGNDDDAFGFFNPPKRLSSRPHCSLLETIPSFSYHNSRFETDGDESVNNEEHPKGVGVDAGFSGGDGGPTGRNLSWVGDGEEGDEGSDGGNHDVEEHYRKMVNESPTNSLLLGNYARFLYEIKQDLQGAEEYYSRSILNDPNDGEILSQYAKLSWELHRDKDRATSYFKRAVHAASEDSHVYASYASFLWETEEEEDDDEEGHHSNIPLPFKNGIITSHATA